MSDRQSSVKLLDAVIVTGAGESHPPINAKRTFQATGQTSAGAGSAVIKVQVSNDRTNWIDIGTVTLTLSATTSTDGFASDAAWRYVRGNVDSISGTDATVTLWLGA